MAEKVRESLTYSGGEDFVQSFKHLMSLNASAVGVITCIASDGIRYGLTATSISSFSMEPPSVLISVNHKAEAHDILIDRRCFGVSFLAVGQEDVAMRFAGFKGEKNEQKFADAHWAETKSGVPVLSDAMFWISCRVKEAVRIATHTIVVGDVVEASLARGSAPSIYYERGFTQLSLGET